MSEKDRFTPPEKPIFEATPEGHVRCHVGSDSHFVTSVYLDVSRMETVVHVGDPKVFTESFCSPGPEDLASILNESHRVVLDPSNVVFDREEGCQ